MESSDTDIVRRYDTALDRAYEQYCAAMQSAGRDEDGVMDILAMIDGRLLHEVQAASGRLGATITAAGKRAKRELVFAALYQAQHEGADITPTVALHVAERVLGRGISMRAATKAFGTPGRTAADKSGIRADDLCGLEEQARHRAVALTERLAEIRQRYRERWAMSLRRAELIDEWRVAMGKAPQDMAQGLLDALRQRIEGM